MSQISLVNDFARVMGCPNQNFVAYDSKQRDEYVKRHLKKTDIYISVYKFTRFLESGYPDHQSAVIDKLFFDFDDDWLSDLRKMHLWCKEHNIKHCAQFSGNGGQFFIATSKSAITNKVEAVGNAQRWFQKTLGIQCDKKIIGDIGRIFRYPNSYNYKGFRWCIPIPPEILDDPNITEDWFYKHATHQMLTVNPWSGSRLLALKPWDKSELLYMPPESFSYELAQINPPSVEILDSYLSEFPKCVQAWMSEQLPPADMKFDLLLYLKEQMVTAAPLDPTEIIGICKACWDPAEFGHYFGTTPQRHHKGHNGVKFKALMKKDYYMPTCVELQSKRFCPGDCGRFNPVYE